MQPPDSDIQKTYTLMEREGGFAVCSPTGREIMFCADNFSASHYIALLNDAYKLGYKLGYRDGRAP